MLTWRVKSCIMFWRGSFQRRILKVSLKKDWIPLNSVNVEHQSWQNKVNYSIVKAMKSFFVLPCLSSQNHVHVMLGKLIQKGLLDRNMLRFSVIPYLRKGWSLPKWQPCHGLEKDANFWCVCNLIYAFSWSINLKNYFFLTLYCNIQQLSQASIYSGPHLLDNLWSPCTSKCQTYYFAFH